MWRFYAILLGFIVLFYVVITFAYPSRILHVHHWTIGLTMAIFLCNQDWITAGMHGFFNGLCVEGGAHWGFDGVWLRKPEPVPDNEDELSENVMEESKTRVEGVDKSALKDDVEEDTTGGTK